MPNGNGMTPPKAPVVGTIAEATAGPSAVSVCLVTLTQRADFLRAARARRQGTMSMMVQARKRSSEEPAHGVRVGYTCSKKVGNAVARNRAKRRLREAARAILPEMGQPGWDYVLIGKAEATAARDFNDLKNDLRYALKKLHAGPK